MALRGTRDTPGRTTLGAGERTRSHLVLSVSLKLCGHVEFYRWIDLLGQNEAGPAASRAGDFSYILDAVQTGRCAQCENDK